MWAAMTKLDDLVGQAGMMRATRSPAHPSLLRYARNVADGRPEGDLKGEFPVVL
jgi:hypothetical protein